MRLHLVRGNTVLATNTENIIPISSMWGMWKKIWYCPKKVFKEGFAIVKKYADNSFISAKQKHEKNAVMPTISY